VKIIKIFRKKDGGIIQLIDKEKMQDWPIELPLIFIEYIRNNQLQNYEDSSIQKEVEKYLDEILRDVAIPRLINVLEGTNDEEILTALTRIEEIGKKRVELIEPIKPYLKNLIDSNSKSVKDLVGTVLSMFEKAERKRKISEKRKIMQEKEKQFLEGKISGEEYAKYRKEYLLLKE
jgi:ABC-type oligopeptide transport system ATPase subunit